MTRHAAGIWLVDASTGRALLLLRSAGVHDGECWGLPGGGVQPDEDEETAVLRELREETGYDGKVWARERVGEVRMPNGGTYGTYVGVVREFVPRLNWEHVDWGWFDLDELPEPLHPGLAAFVEGEWDTLAGIARDVVR